MSIIEKKETIGLNLRRSTFFIVCFIWLLNRKIYLNKSTAVISWSNWLLSLKMTNFLPTLWPICFRKPFKKGQWALHVYVIANFVAKWLFTILNDSNVFTCVRLVWIFQSTIFEVIRLPQSTEANLIKCRPPQSSNYWQFPSSPNTLVLNKSITFWIVQSLTITIHLECSAHHVVYLETWTTTG